MARSSVGKKVRAFNQARLIDFATRVVLGLFFAFVSGIYYKNAMAQFHRADMTAFNITSFSHGLSILAAGIFTMMIGFLYIVRLRPVSKFPGVVPAVAAVLGGFMLFSLVLFKAPDNLSVSAQLIASCLSLAGNMMAAFIVIKLGKSFSILPESRKLVTTGPYTFVRHPLYLAEAVATIGTMILFIPPLTIALVITQFALQLVRIHYEEHVLSETFPEYKKYAKRTARLIPGVY
jgi:protein-S-isoprenylcysteine O-methyltransferase Ste14